MVPLPVSVGYDTALTRPVGARFPPARRRCGGGSLPRAHHLLCVQTVQPFVVRLTLARRARVVPFAHLGPAASECVGTRQKAVPAVLAGTRVVPDGKNDRSGKQQRPAEP